MTSSPLGIVRRVATILDELGIPYALGGSLASSIMGNPRSTADADIAISIRETQGAALLDRLAADFYVPVDHARTALRERTSFNVIAGDLATKLDVFVLGEAPLDVAQITRAVTVEVEGIGVLRVTAPEDQILRKLCWYRDGGMTSDRQWRDVVALLRIRAESLDSAHLEHLAAALGLEPLLAAARADAQS